MKLFSTKKHVQISDEIDSIRRNKNVQEFDKWRKISEMVIKDLHRKGQFFDTQQGQFFFDGDFQDYLPNTIGSVAVLSVHTWGGTTSICLDTTQFEAQCRPVEQKWIGRIMHLNHAS